MAGINSIFAPDRASVPGTRQQGFIPGNFNQTEKEEKGSARKMREMIRSLQRSAEEGSHTGTIRGKENGYLDLTRSKADSGKQEKTN